eukprot:6019078-Prymnesium_polylepis.2
MPEGGPQQMVPILVGGSGLGCVGVVVRGPSRLRVGRMSGWRRRARGHACRAGSSTSRLLRAHPGRRQGCFAFQRRNLRW